MSIQDQVDIQRLKEQVAELQRRVDALEEARARKPKGTPDHG